MKFNKRKMGADPHVTLYNKQIRVVDGTCYLGLILDKQLSWKEYIEYLYQNCTQVINLLKHLSNLSWGSYRKTLLNIYVTLVCLKLDNGCQFYRMAHKKLSFKNMYNMGIQILSNMRVSVCYNLE